MRADSARQYCSDQKKIAQITATLQIPNPAKGLVKVQIHAAIRAAQQAAGQCPVPFLALQILRVRQQNVERRKRLPACITQRLQDGCRRLTFQHFDARPGRRGDESTLAQQAGDGFIRRISQPREQQHLLTLIQLTDHRKIPPPIGGSALGEQALGDGVQVGRHVLGLQQLAHSLSHSGVDASHAAGEQRWRSAGCAADEDRLLRFVNVIDVPGAAGEQDALPDRERLRDRQCAQRLATGNDAEFFVGSKGGIEGVVINQLFADSTVQQDARSVLHQQLLLAEMPDQLDEFGLAHVGKRRRRCA